MTDDKVFARMFHPPSALIATPARIAITYFIFSAVYIISSDFILLTLVEDTAAIAIWQQIKGVGFCVFSAIILYYLISRAMRVHSKNDIQEKSLKRDQLELALEAADIGTWHQDCRTGEMTWDEQMHRLFGTDPAAFQVRDSTALGKIVVPEDIGAVADINPQAARTTQDFFSEFHVRRPNDGAIREFVLRARTRYDDDGSPRALYGICTDVTDVRHTAQQLTQSEQRLAHIVENMSDAFILFDNDWRILEINPEAEKTLNIPRAELIGYGLPEKFPEQAKQDYFQRYMRAKENGEIQRFESYDDNLKRWFAVTAYPLNDGLAAFFRDNTEERRIKDAARRISEQFRVIFDTAPLGVALMNTSGIFVAANPKFVAMLGHGGKPIIGQEFVTIFDEIDPETERARFAELIASDLVFAKLERKVSRPNQNELWVEFSVSVERDENGKATACTLVAVDVTDNRQAQQALAMSEERLSAVIETAMDGIVTVDENYKIIVFNHAAEMIFGWTSSEIKGRQLDVLIPEARRIGHQKNMETFGHGESTARQMGRMRQVQGLRRSGEVFPIEASISHVTTHDGKLFTAVIRDVTEHLRIENQLRQAQKMDAVGQLTGGIAHDFNNLLTVIIGNTEMLVEDLAANEDLKGQAAIALKAAERGAELTERLLAFSRQQELEPQIVELSGLVADTVKLLERILEENITVETHLPTDPVLARVDPGQLQNALVNLAVNARDAMEDGGTLILEVDEQNLDEDYARRVGELAPAHYGVISVSDTGSGMPADVVERAFEPFFTTKEVGRGTGLGLSMVYGFAKQSGGNATIYSEAGQGTTVRLYLPVVENDEIHKATGTSTASANSSRRSAKILAVEDDELVRDHVTKQLVKLGYQVTTVTNAAEAWDKLNSGETYDLLFSDIVMPGGVNGVDLARDARTRFPAMRILLTTGYTEASLRHAVKHDDSFEILSKPYKLSDLAKTISRILGLSNA